jgi:hypothetical protein
VMETVMGAFMRSKLTGEDAKLTNFRLASPI